METPVIGSPQIVYLKKFVVKMLVIYGYHVVDHFISLKRDKNEISVKSRFGSIIIIPIVVNFFLYEEHFFVISVH